MGKVKGKFLFIYRQITMFYIPNLSKLIFGNTIKFESLPITQQRLVFTGKGEVNLGKKCKFGFLLGGFHRNGCIEIQPRGRKSVIVLGNNISTNNNIFICSENYIEIKDNALIGQNVTIMDFEAHGIKPSERRSNIIKGEVVIEKNVWIGSNVIILKNTKIGENSIVAAGAIVSGDFPSNVIIGGIPAKVIKSIDE